MKTKVVIENGETEIILTPENVFEKDILEKMRSRRQNYTIHTNVEANYDFGSYKDHKIVLNIKDIKDEGK